MRGLRATALAAALAAGGCRAAAAPEPAPRSGTLATQSDAIPEADAASETTGPARADARWRALAAQTESAAQSVWPPAAASVGFPFDPGREPVLALEESAPPEGDVVVRFVEGVRRPVVRVQPGALLRGEFLVPDDLAPLAASAALLAAARERALPPWVVAGGGIVAAGAFERRLHVRALGGLKVLSRESELFGDPSVDALAGAARVKALLRIARGERALTRFVTALLDGHDEDTALELVGVADRAFLDAAAGTERARAASSIADHPDLAWLVTHRDRLGQGEVDGRDAVVVQASTASDARNPWITADVYLQRALIALVTGDVSHARELFKAAPPSRVVRTQERRIVEALVAPARERADATLALIEDWPSLATTNGVLRTLVMNPPVPK